METERIHNLIDDGFSRQQTCLMVGDYSKRTLAVDRKSTIPTKKKKQTQEESELCDVSIDQNLNKNEMNEEVTNFCSRFDKENVCGSTSSASEKELNEGKIEFNLQSSVCVKADNSAEWINLNCFDGIINDGSSSATFFVGGPIQSSAFLITPHDIKVNQYVAVAAGSSIHNNHSLNDTKNVSGIIQFWNVGSVHKRKTLKQSPLMELAFYHDNGIITQMKWCPADCYDKHPSTFHLPRLGLLAASSSDSCVYIYNVPQPDFMPKSKPIFPIYFTLPFMKLVPLFGGPSSITRKAVATCMEWEKNGDRIVAGYGNGAVCVWMTKASSFASNIAVKNTEQSCIIQPYLFFQASGAPIASLSFSPFHNHRWLVVSSIDKMLKFFDLYDTSAPFHAVKQGFENSCIWSHAFCGVYCSASLNSGGLVSLSAKDCCSEKDDKAPMKGFFDCSTYVAVSEKRNFHAIADMAGVVTVNFLKDILTPLETYYLTYMVFETEIVALDSINIEPKSSGCKISISGIIPSCDITSDSKIGFNTKIKQACSSSSSSSGFCSPKQGKTIVIEMTQSNDNNEAVKLLTSPSGSPLMTDFKDINNNRQIFLNKPLPFDKETYDEMINYCGFSGDLMHDLLMAKIANQSKSSSHILPFNSSNNSAYWDSKGAKQLSDVALVTSPASSDYTGDTIVYPFEPCFCDTSHPNALISDKQYESFSLNDKGNTMHRTAMLKKDGESALKTKIYAENSLDFSYAYAKSRISHPRENSPPKDWCLNHNAENHFDSKTDAIKLPSQESFNSPLSNVLHSNTLNLPKPVPDMCLSEASNNYIICDKDDQVVSDRALIESSAASDYSGETIIYFPESHDCDKTEANYLKMKKPGATLQSLYRSDKEYAFHNTLLHKVDEKEVYAYGSESKLFTENSSSFTTEKCKYFLTKDSQKYSSEFEIDSATQSSNSSHENRTFFQKEYSVSDFELLHSEYVCEKSKEKHSELNKSPQECSYENLIGSFGVVYKNNLDKFSNPLKHQKNDICLQHNPLSVIKTISGNPNEGCESWLFIGGNSGIGRLVFIPDFVTTNGRNPRSRSKKKQV